MALDHVTDIVIKMQQPQESQIEPQAAMYFEQTFKAKFKLLEK